jgi:subtilase family serine protease
MKLRPSIAIGFATWLLLLSMMPAVAVPRQVMHGHVPAVVARLQPMGNFAGTNHLNLAIGLPLRNPETLSNLLRQIYDPASTSYRHYLTPQQFTEQFGPTKKDYQAVIAFAKANGLTITGTDPTRMLVDVSGSVADIERTLHMTLRVYQHPTEKRMFHAPDVEPSLDLAVPILRISGLDNYSLPRPRLQATPLANASKALPNAGSGPSGTYMGKDFRAAYVPDSSLNGSGQIVGLLQFDGYTASDITYYENQAGLPSVTLSNVLIDGATGNPSGSGGEVEVSLDIEMAVSMATNLSKVIVYMAPNPSPWEDLLNRMANDNLAKQLSCSWYAPGAGADTNADQIFQKMAAYGQSFFSASGDYDAYTGLIPFPGDTPYITQVGGTTLTTTGPGGSWVSETVWNWGGGIGSGGGISTQYPIPSWQENINMTANQGSTTMRNTPDVALTADNVYVRADSLNYNVGGTSCAAPLWAGFAALVNQQAAASGKPTVGFINPAVSALGATPTHTSAFHDITTGNNTSGSSPTRFYAVSGYDLCTGWGTPAGQNLINALANPEALLITPSSGFASIGGVGGPFTITSQSLTLTNAGTNSLTWTLANTSVWLNASPSGGILTPGGAATTVTVSLNTAASNLLVGMYSTTVWFTNLNSRVGQSRQFTLAVISPPTITAQPADQAVLEGATAMFTVAATGGLPLFYQWQDNGTNLTDGGNISGSTTTNLTINSVSAANVGTYSVIVSNIAGVTTSSTALLTISPSPPVIILQPMTQTAVVGGTVTFTVAAIGSTPFFYQWSFNGTNISGATNVTLALANVQLTQAGNYAVQVSNVLGLATSSNAILTVYTVPVITSFSPPSGAAGTVVNISGLNFDPISGNNIVYFGAVQAAVTAASVTNLKVTVPVSATYAPITVTVNGLTAYANQPFMPTFAGDGSGISTSSFAPQLVLPAGNGPGRVIIADLDGDGKPDLIVANTYGNTISLYQNISTNGSLTAGSFAPPVNLVTPPGSYSPMDLVVADVEGDGKLDIIVSDYDQSIVSVYQNTCTPGNISSNSFATRVDFATGAQPQGVAVADIDGDGKPDLLVANSGDGTVSILRNTGVMGSLTTNSFAPKVDFATGSGCVRVAAVDLEGDGKPDVVVVDYNDSSGTMSVLQNNCTPGNLSFATKVDFPCLPDCLDVRACDLDGDGQLDLVVTEGAYGQAISVFRNTSTTGGITTNSLAPRVDFAVGAWAHTMAFGDLDGDGKPDVAVACELPSQLSIFKNTSSPGSFTTNSFAPPVDFATGYNAWGVAIGDLDGDGRPDIVFANQYDNTISIYQSQVPFGGPPVILAQPGNQAVYVGITANFSVTATGSLPLSYQWSFSGTNIVGATNTTLTLTNVQLSQAGAYAVTITNNYGSVISSNAVLTVNLPPPCAPVPSGLVSWWPGEGNAYDVVGANNGTLVNGVSFAPGEVGQAFSFDGTSGYVSIPDSPSLDTFVSSITIETWIKFNQVDTSPNWNGIVTKGNSSWRLALYGNSFVIGFSTTGLSNVDLAGNKNINDGQWHHVAAIYDETNKYIYVDGVLDASTPATGTIAQNSYPVCIGENAEAPGHLWNGLIDEVSIYNRALTASEIQLIYVAGSGGKCPPSPTPPSITIQPTNQTVVVGGTANFSVMASGTPPLNYQWNFNGTNMSGATNTSLTLTSVQLTQAGTYAVTITNNNGSVISSNAMLTVNPPPTNVPVITGFSPISGFVGTSVNISGTNFSAVAANNTVYFGAVQAVVRAASTTNLVVTVPAGATYAPITETVGGLVAYANTAFEPTFLGDGSALGPSSFAPRVDLACGNGPILTAIADLDGDGKPDLVVANYYDGTISLFRNISTNGTLSFGPRVDLPSFGGNPWGLAVADVDGDGKPDLVVSDSSNGRVLVYRNISTVGTLTTDSFAAPVAFSVGNFPMAVRVGDLDGDGRPDIVCVNNGDNTLSLLRNIGMAGSLTTNSFAPQVVLATGPGPHDLVIVDLDGDGKPDIAEVNYTPSFFSVFRNTSVPGVINTNSFAARVDFATSGEGNSIVVGDVDGDGKPDVIVGLASGSAISVYRNLASPGTLNTNSFAAEVDFPAPGLVRGLGMGDLNGDGKPDISLVGEEGSFMSVYQNVSTPGSFTNTSLAGRVDYGTGDNAQGVTIGDLDGDGRPDIVFVNFYDSTISIYQNQVPFGGPPVILAQPGNQAVYVGLTANFSVTASGTPPLSYQWNFNGTNISGATNISLTLTNVQLNQAGNYAVLVTNAYGWTNSATAVLTVIALPPFIILQPTNQTIIVGTNVTFNVTAGGSLPLSYQWNFNGTNLNGATNAMLTMINVQVTQAGNYAVLVTNAYGSVLSSNAVLTVNPAPVPVPANPRPANLATNVPANTNLMWDNGIGSQVISNGTFETGTLAGWNQVQSASGKFVINNGTFKPPGPDGPLPPYAGSYSALGEESGPGVFYIYQDVSIPSNATSATLSWAHRVRNFYTAFSSSQQFRVELRDTNNNVLAVAFTTQPGDPLLDNWVQKSYDVTSFAGQKLRVTFLVNSGLYYLDVHVDNVSVQVNGLSGAITNNVYLGTNPTPGPAEFQGSTTNSSWTLPLLAPLTTYYWQIVAHRGGSATGAVWQFTTAGVDHFVWNAISSPQYTNQPFGVVITAKDAFNTTVSNFNGSAALGATNGPISMVPTNTGAFIKGIWAGSVTVQQRATNLVLRASDGNGHTGTGNPFDVVPPNMPPVILAQPTNQTAVVGGTAMFMVAADGTPPLNYQWNFNGTNMSGATNTSLTLTNVQLSQAGNYAVQVSNVLGLATSSNAILTVYTVPVITSFSPPAGAAGTVVNISGLNFDPTPGNNTVYFGAVQAMVTAASMTNLVVTVPAGATYAPITETVGGLVAYANTAFEPTFLGDGSALGPSSFAPRVDLACGSGPYFTSIADLDGDGKPDVVTINYYDGNISLFRNISTNGTLSFAPRVDLPSFGGAPLGLAVADVDGDGKLDLVVSDSSNSRVLVYRNISTVGTLTTNSFAAPVAFSVGNSPVAVRVRDLDGDGRPDIVCVNSGDNTLSILRNIGTAGSLTTNSFAPQVVLATGPEPHDLVIVDLDGDGKPDLAQVNYTPSFFSVFRNTSVPGVINTNSFAARVDFATSGEGDSIIVGDVDGDGKPDVIVGLASGSAISVYRNLARPGSLDTNSFAAEVDFPAPGWVRGVALGDLNGDGKPDISLIGEEGNFMSVYQNVSTPGSFTNMSLASRVDYGAGWDPHGVMIGDLDGDGRPDIIFGNQYDSTLSIYQNIMPFGGPPVIATQPTNQTVIVSGTANFSVTASGTPPLSYQWNFNGTNIVGATNTTLTLINVQVRQAGNYAVLVTNVYGSATSIVATLSVAISPVIASQPKNQFVPLGCDATFNVCAWGTKPLSYQWWKDGLALSGQTNMSLMLTNVQTSDFGNYSVVVTNDFGSVTSSPAQLALGHPPVANPDTIYRFAAGGVRVNVGGLLANDTDPDGDSLTIIGVSPNSAAGGTVGLTNNWVYYAPPGGSANGDTFTYIVSDGHCGTDVGTVTVQIKADNPQPLTFAIANPGDGFIRLTFDGIPGYTYWIEYTDDLSNPDWQTLNTETADGFGVCQFVDGSLTNAPARFYRAVWP